MLTSISPVDGRYYRTLNKGCVSYTENEKLSLNGIYYICENEVWKEITATEYGLGYCTTAKNGAVEKLNDVYYICKTNSWNIATVLEYDTYGKTCSTDGAIVNGRITPTNKYVCDTGAFRAANEQEKTLNNRKIQPLLKKWGCWSCLWHKKDVPDGETARG